MTRRDMVRRAMLFATAMILGKMDSAKAEGAQLTMNLSQWSAVVFEYRGKTVTIPVAEIFESLK